MNLGQVRTIVTHDDCADGTASAILLHDALPSARVVFCKYGTKEHLEMRAEPGLLFCDFSPPAERAREFVDAGAIVLDHHKTAKEIVESFGENGRFGDEATEPGVCGAVLAYRHVWSVCQDAVDDERDRALDFATLAGIRDTWQRTNPRWREACAQAEALRFWPRATLLDHALPFADDWLEDILDLGEVLLEKRAVAVVRAIEGAIRYTSKKGTRVLVFQGVGETSDAAESLGDSADLVVGFLYLAEGGPKLVLSTRSHTGYDCAALAKRYGGGGHTAAAGFSVPVNLELSPNPYTNVMDLVDEHETTP